MECIAALRTGLSVHPTLSSCSPYCSQAGFAFQNLVVFVCLFVFVLFVLELWSQTQKAVFHLLGHTACEREGVCVGCVSIKQELSLGLQ